MADSGSTDGTLDAARSLGCRIIEREYVDSGDFKNWAIPQAKHQWVLVVDADERVTPELATEIRELLRGRPAHDGYRVRRHNHFLGHRLRHVGGAATGDSPLSPGRSGGIACTPTTRKSTYRPTGSDLYMVGAFQLLGLRHVPPKDATLHVAASAALAPCGRPPSFRHLMTNGPIRFLRCLLCTVVSSMDPWAFKSAALTGFYSFLKQAKLWQIAWRLTTTAATTRRHFGTG